MDIIIDMVTTDWYSDVRSDPYGTVIKINVDKLVLEAYTFNLTIPTYFQKKPLDIIIAMTTENQW